MKIWIFVEGPSDRLALEALWQTWHRKLRQEGHGIKVISFKNKSEFLRKVGARVAEKLCGNKEDIAVGLPDLYPNRDFENTSWKHDDLTQLQAIQKREVSAALESIYGVPKLQIEKSLERFYASALKHDLEMLLLAAQDKLRRHLGTSEHLGSWRKPVEDQDQNQPPKHIVEQLFRTKSVGKRSYRQTKDAHAILSKVSDLKEIIYDSTNRIQCPVFKALLDWIGEKTGVVAYQEL